MNKFRLLFTRSIEIASNQLMFPSNRKTVFWWVIAPFCEAESQFIWLFVDIFHCYVFIIVTITVIWIIGIMDSGFY